MLENWENNTTEEISSAPPPLPGVATQALTVTYHHWSGIPHRSHVEPESVATVPTQEFTPKIIVGWSGIEGIAGVLDVSELVIP